MQKRLPRPLTQRQETEVAKKPLTKVGTTLSGKAAALRSLPRTLFACGRPA